MRFLISGTGRCGTGFCTRLFLSAGVNCSHEGIFNLHGWENAYRQLLHMRSHPSQGWQAEASWLAFPHLMRSELYNVTVIHLVREPIKVVESLIRMGFFTLSPVLPYSSYVHHYLPYMEQLEDPVEKAVYMYLKINWFVEERADVFHRIEDEPTELLDKLGIDYQEKELFDNRTHNTRTNYCDYGEEEVDFDKLPTHLREEIMQMGERYGY